MERNEYRALAYNGSGYYDDTAFKALKNIERSQNLKRRTPERGEIWMTATAAGKKKEVLVVAVHASYDTTLTLSDQPSGENTLRVQSGIVRYADAGRLGFMFHDKAREYIGTVRKEEMEKILTAVAAALGIRTAPVREEKGKGDETGAEKPGEEISVLKEENARLIRERDIYRELLYEEIPRIAKEMCHNCRTEQ